MDNQKGSEMLEEILSILESYNYCKVCCCINCQNWKSWHHYHDGKPFNGRCMVFNIDTHYDDYCSEAAERIKE